METNNKIYFHEIKPLFFVLKQEGMTAEYNNDFSMLLDKKTLNNTFDILGKKITVIYPDIFYEYHSWYKIPYFPMFDILRLDGTLVSKDTQYFYSTSKNINNIVTFLNKIGFSANCGRATSYSRAYRDECSIPIYDYGFGNCIVVHLKLNDIIGKYDNFQILKVWEELYAVPERICEARGKYGDCAVFFINGRLHVKILHSKYGFMAIYKASDFLYAIIEKGITRSKVQIAVERICTKLSEIFQLNGIKFPKNKMNCLYQHGRKFIRDGFYNEEGFSLKLIDFVNELIKRNLYKYI